MLVSSPIRRLGFVSLAAVLSVPAAASAQAPFVDITPPDVASTLNNIGGGWADFDGDGDLDISSSVFSGAGHLLLHRNDGGELFVSVGDSLLPPPAGNSSGAAWGDYDGDGDLDAVCSTSSTPAYLFRNDGDGFVDRSSGDLAALGTGGRTATWVDFDVDGDLDVYLANTGTTNKLYRNDGNDVFTNVTSTSVMGPSQAIAWADYDSDGDMDLYVGRQNNPDVLARNDGGGNFANVTTAAGLGNAGSNLGVCWGDYNNDGHPDVHIANGGSGDALYRNNGDGTFTDVFAPIPVRGGGGTHVGSNWGDYDLDGDLDLFVGGYFGSESLLLRNDGNDSFSNQADSVLAAQFADGGAWGDFDGDGDLDLFIPTEGAADALFRNDDASGNRWLQLDLVGTTSNASAIGARVIATAGGLTQIREVHSSSGWGQHNALTVAFGFGSTTTVQDVDIRWPSGIVQGLANVSTNQRTVVREVLVVNPATYAIGSAVDVSVPISSVLATSVTLAYRVAGSTAAFDSLDMAHANDVASATVPANRATDRGIEGHVIWTTTAGTTISAPIFIAANLPAQALPAIPAPEQHLLFGFPFQPSSPSPAATVEDELGAPDPTKWRLGRWDPAGDRYREHPGDALNMSAGNGFWLIQRNPVAVSSTGQPVSTVGGFPISLPPGWTMIAHPYLFPVAFANLNFDDAPNVEGRLVGFINGYANETVLAPWRGYWMRNNGPTAETVIVPGTESVPQPAPPAQLAAGDWRLEVSARQGVMTDLENVLGVSAEATDEPDRLDFHEPPAFPGVVRVYFENPDAGSAIHELSQDLRPEGADGNAWDLVIDAPEGDPVHVSFQGVAAIDEAQAVWLITEDTWAVTDLRERAELTLPSGRTHRFRLVVGSETFAESVSAGQDRLPVAFALGASYPNPFASTTSFSLALPREASVELTVYDVTGRRVRTLHSGPLSAGRHTVGWNATDESGSRVAPGVYFAKMASEGFTGSRKVVVLQ